MALNLQAIASNSTQSAKFVYGPTLCFIGLDEKMFPVASLERIEEKNKKGLWILDLKFFDIFILILFEISNATF